MQPLLKKVQPLLENDEPLCKKMFPLLKNAQPLCKKMLPLLKKTNPLRKKVQPLCLLTNLLFEFRFISDNFMMTANVLAKETDVSLHTIRHYTRIGLLQPSRNPHNNYKVYQSSDAVRLKFIVAAKSLGFTLAEITQILDRAEHGASPCPMVRNIIVRHIAENERKIKELQNLQKTMKKALNDWNDLQDAMPNGTSVCHLIESVAEV